MTPRKIGTLPLCAMMTGAVLGSGVIILPPLALESAGAWALPAWAAILLVGIGFAYVFAKIGTLIPGDGGAASAIEMAFGPEAKQLASMALMGAVLFGPAAVMVTIIEYLPPELLPDSPTGKAWAGTLLVLACQPLLLSGLRNMSRATMVLSVSATGLLLAGSLIVLSSHAAPAQALPPLEPGPMGHTLLLLFWAIVGWEVVGNYGAEIRNARTTVPRAAVMAGGVVALIDLAVAAALQYQNLENGSGHGVAVLLSPLLREHAPFVMSLLTTGLCLTTYLAFVGAVARLTAHLADRGRMPAILARRNSLGAPTTAMLIYATAHILQVWLVNLEVTSLSGIVAAADGFFLTNALLGSLAALKVLPSKAGRLTAGFLSLFVAVVFIQSHWQILGVVGIAAGWHLFRHLQARGVAVQAD